MLNAIKQRLDREDEGFTLIELMVVVLIIAILLAIAIPTFLGARNAANARSAQSNLRNALTAEQTQWTNSQAFSSDATTMGAIESALTFTNVAPVSGNNVSVAVGDNDTSSNAQQVMLGGYGKDGNCWFILQSNDPANSFTAYGAVKQDASAKTCPNTAVAAVGGITPTFGSGGAGSTPGASGAVPTTWYHSF